jgi:hypothetical protein
MGNISRTPSRNYSSDPALRQAPQRERLETDALAEVAREVGADCRVQPKGYLDEVRVPAAGE